MGKPVKITLGVNAFELYNANPQPSNQTELDNYCRLIDDNGGHIPPGDTEQTIQNFTSEVYHNKKVKWKAINTVPGDDYQVSIVQVSNDSDYFTENPIMAKDNNGWTSGDLTATLTGTDTYTIEFTVIPPTGVGHGAAVYQLDPKLHGNNT